MQQSCTSEEKNLFEKLSEFLKIFNRIMGTIETVAMLMEHEEQYSLQLKNLLAFLEEQQSQPEQLDYPLPRSSNIDKTISRFINRLTENFVYIPKSSANFQGSHLIERLHAKISELIKIHKQSRNMGKLFIQIFKVTKKFCIVGLQFLNGDPIQADGVFYGIIPQKQAEESEKKNIPPPNNEVHQNESHFHKVMNMVNNRFSTLNCLDLDFSAFKTFYFQTRSQNEEQLASQTMQRNCLALKEITHYQKRFNDYMKRRQRMLQRRNRIIELEERKNINTQHFKNYSVTPTSSFLNRNRRNQICEIRDLEEAINQEININYETLVENTSNTQFQQQTNRQITHNDVIDRKKKIIGCYLKNIHLTFGSTPIQTNREEKSPALLQDPYQQNKQVVNNKMSESKQAKPRERLIKLTPVRLNIQEKDYFGEPSNTSESQWQERLSVGRRSNVIHRFNFAKKNQVNFKNIRISSIGQRWQNSLKSRQPTNEVIERFSRKINPEGECLS